MTRHAPQEPTQNQYGDDVHPAFGMINVTRSTNNFGEVLFGSDIRHAQTMTIRIVRASRKRDLKHDWVHPGGEVIAEVELSEAQWAAFVSSPNTSGVECTIRQTQAEFDVPGLRYAPRLAETTREVEAAADEAYSRIEAAMAAYEALDPKAPAKAKREALSTLRATIRNARPNVEFAGKRLREHTEDVVQKARADIEAVVINKARQLGIDPAEVGQVALGPAEPEPVVAIDPERAYSEAKCWTCGTTQEVHPSGWFVDQLGTGATAEQAIAAAVEWRSTHPADDDGEG